MAACASPTRHISTPSRSPSPLQQSTTLLQVATALQYTPDSPISAGFNLSYQASSPTSPSRREPRKMFVCTGYGNCTMAFSRSEHLARHIRKHTGERPFRCHCGRDFSRLDNLRQHAQTVHADQQEANNAMMGRLQAVHNQLSAQTSSKKRKANSTTPPGLLASPGVGHGPVNGLPLLPPPPIGLMNFAPPHPGSSSPNYVASPRQHPALSEPYYGYGDHFHHFSSPYVGQPAYGMYPQTGEVEQEGRPALPSIAAMVPRQMPLPPTTSPYLASPLMATSGIFSNGHPAHPRSPAVAATRPQPYPPTTAPYHVPPMQPYSPSQAELYEAEASLALAHSPALSYVHTPNPQSMASPAPHYTNTPLSQSFAFEGASDDGKGEPPLSHSADGASTGYPSPSTPSPTHSAAAVKGLGDLVPPEFFAHHSAPSDMASHGNHASFIMARTAAGSRLGDERPPRYYNTSPALTQGTPSPKLHQHGLVHPHSAPTSYTGYMAPMSPVSSPLKRARDDDDLLRYADDRIKRSMVSST